MFTGLIEATGQIASISGREAGERVRIATELGAELTSGDSIAVNGVCLTAVECDPSGFAADVSPETMRVTTWKAAAVGQVVNLERPVRADGRLGGHFVLGHVDAVGRVTRFEADGECHWLAVRIDESMLGLVVPKGSVAVDGVSLTVARLEGPIVEIQLIPFTVAHTAFRTTRVGDAVNLECDVLGKYVARLMEATGFSVAGVPDAAGGRR